MPWYKLPHTDQVMFFRGERADLEPAEAPRKKHPAKAKPTAPAEPATKEPEASS